jgi:hypothetical protein
LRLANDEILARLKRLANDLDAAKTSSEATARQVQHAKKITEKVKKDVRLLDTSKTTRTHKRPGKKR